MSALARARPLALALAAIVGRDGVTDDPGALAVAAVDGVVPRAVVRATSRDHVAAPVGRNVTAGPAVAGVAMACRTDRERGSTTVNRVPRVLLSTRM